jgi:hypothetical protein
VIEEHAKAVLTTDLPEHNLKAGDVGTIVHIYSDGKAYELEIFSVEGHTVDVVTVAATQVRAVSPRDIWAAREQSA